MQKNHLSWDSSNKTKYYPIFRYAEVLLGYVEAMIEMAGSYIEKSTGITVTRDVDQMVFYFNQIRYRAGLSGITSADASNQAAMRNIIKQQWRVEFFNEDRRYYDLYRWLDAPAPIAYQRPVYGLDVSQKTDHFIFLGI